MKLYILHTAATHEEVTECGAWLATKTGQLAVFDEAPSGYVVAAPADTVWTQTRWLAAIAVLSASPFVFRFAQHFAPGLTPLQGFGVGWIAAVLVLLLGRNAMRAP
jgi:hypothetical protein